MNLFETMAVPCPRPNPERLIKAPYGKKAADWAEAQDAALKQSGIGRAGREALRCWAIRETRAGKSLDFTPHQLAELGGCSIRTIYLEIPRLQKANLIELVTPGSRGNRIASLFRLSVAMPEWGGITTARTPERDTRVQNLRTPLDLRSLHDYPPYPPTASDTPPVLPPLGLAKANTEPGNFAGLGLPSQDKTPEKALAEELLQAGCQLPGVIAAVKTASLEKRIKNARTDVRAIIAYLELHPGWVKNPAGLLIRSVQDPARARSIRRQLRYHRLNDRRARDSASAPSMAEIALAPEPIQIDIRELLADSREVFQELPPEAQARIQACVAREALNPDRAFVDAVGSAIREARLCDG